MSRSLLLGSSVLALLAAAALAWWLVSLEPPARARTNTESSPAAPVETHELAEPEAAQADELAARAPAAPLETPAVTLEARPAEPTLQVQARLVDERGQPLADGELRVRLVEGELGARAEPNGEVTLLVDPLQLPERSQVSFRARAPARVERSLGVDRILFEGKSAYFLGEVTLRPGGSLIGRVLGEDGTGVSGAALCATPVGAQSSDEQRTAVRVWMPWSDFGDGIRINRTCGTDGSFRLEGVPAGRVDVYASDGRHLVACAPDVEVRAGAETLVPDLVLRAAGDGERIAGLVRGADGKPFVGAFIRLSDEQESVLYGKEARSDADGCFALLAVPERTYAVTAFDPAHMQPARRKGVHAGDVSIELRLDGHSLEVAARDALGPVAQFRAVVESSEHRGLAGAWSEAGLARVSVPEEAFFVRVLEPFHRAQVRGPFEPGAAPARLDVELERVGGIAGVVLADGRPVPGASVHAHLALEGGGFAYLGEGFFTSVGGPIGEQVLADEQGRFFVPVPIGARLCLHAEAPRHARGVSAWLDFVDGERRDGLELVLPAGGAIEGQLIVARDVEARGVWIGASDCDGHVALGQAGEQGRFRFDDLAPGSWQVHRVTPGQERKLAGRPNLYQAGDTGFEPAFDLEVRSGQTTRFDIDARDEIPCVLEGRMTFGGAVVSGWNAFLDQKRAPLDAEGRFTLRAAKAGRHWISFSAGRARIGLPLDLDPGANTWERDFPVGTVQLVNLPPPPEMPAASSGLDWPSFALSWTDGKATWQFSFQRDPSAGARIECVPAGHVQLHFCQDLRSDSPEQCPVLLEFELTAGEIQDLRLP